jgi:hypothetical protein
LFGWTRCTYDINQAYLLGKAEANQRFAMRYPEGRIRESYKIYAKLFATSGLGDVGFFTLRFWTFGC